jgi:hypothetical protein
MSMCLLQRKKYDREKKMVLFYLLGIFRRSILIFLLKNSC